MNRQPRITKEMRGTRKKKRQKKRDKNECRASEGHARHGLI